jgi:hypothetical protein
LDKVSPLKELIKRTFPLYHLPLDKEIDEGERGGSDEDRKNVDKMY